MMDREMTAKRAAVALLVGATFVVGLPFATASSAEATPTAFTVAASVQQASVASCKDKPCSNKNPHTTKCDKDARTIDKVTPGGGGPKVELRYSKKCRAAWARMETAVGWPFRLEVRNGPFYNAYGSLNYRAYTKMTGVSETYRACVKQYASDSWTCTGWH
jgi:hypothetical protein